jgi:ABC-2 type transport system ATP-binding protein
VDVTFFVRVEPRVEGNRPVPDHETFAAIQVSGLGKHYGGLAALNSVTFSVGRGEVFAYLGPNGAGKTTTINILCGLLRRDAGDVTVCGADVDRDPMSVKQRIGVVPEDSNLYPELSSRRNLDYVGELYGLARAARRTRTGELLEQFGLAGKAGARFRSLSRGMKRRLTIAAGLVHSPEILLLDEPTAGLDVPSARSLRGHIQAIRRAGTTVFLTTHNLAEAEELADHVLILVNGRVAAHGTAAEIQQRVERARTLSVVFSGGVTEAALRRECPAVRSAAAVNGAWQIEFTEAHAAVAQIAAFAERHGVRIVEINTAGASLEDAFLSILQEGGP